MFTRDVLKDTAAPAYALLIVVLRKYGFECLDWEPELLKHALEQDHDVKISDLQSDKLQAAMLVMTTNSYETFWPVFEKVTHTFNNDSDDFDTLNPLEAEQLITGLAEVTLIKHAVMDHDEILEFSDEIRAYAGRVFYEYGMSEPPELFPSALMPPAVKSKNKEKNEALAELYNARAIKTLEYLDKL